MSEGYTTHEIDDIGSVRARTGTSTEELAGAASYWNARAKKAERINAAKWGDGCAVGTIIAFVVVNAAWFAHSFGLF